MAKTVITLAYLNVNSVDLSAWVRDVTLTYEADAVDQTTMGGTTRLFLGGLKSWSISANLAQDYAASAVHATLFPLVGSTFPVEVRASSAAVSATNPRFTGTGLLVSYSVVQGSVGDLQESPIQIVAASVLATASV